MDQETIRRQLADDLPEYELVPESNSDEDAAADEPVEVEANAGPVKAWRRARKFAGPSKGMEISTSSLLNRFQKRELL